MNTRNDPPKVRLIINKNKPYMDNDKISWKFTKDEKDKIVKLWLNGKSTYRIAKIFGCNDESIRLIIRYRVPKEKYFQNVKEHMKRFEERRKIKIIKKPKLNEELAWWVGVVKGDGHVAESGYYVYVSTKDNDLAERWAHIGKNLFGIKPKFRFVKEKELHLIYFNSKNIVNFIKKNYGKFGRYIWDVPQRIKKSNSKVIFAFIRGLFDAEGSMKYYPKKRGARLTMVSVRKESIEEIKKILLMFEIQSKISIYKRMDRKNFYYILEIMSFQNISKFYKNIHFTIERKNLKLFEYMKASHRRFEN